MRDSVTEAVSLISVVSRDRALPRFIRQEAKRLLPLATSKPEMAELVWDRLETLRHRVLPDLPLWPPTCDYARCVSVDTFWRFHIARTHRGFFQHHEQYRRYLEARSDPASVARTHLTDGILVPAPNSWLIPANRIASLNGTQTRKLLRFEQKPPYLIMIFPVERMQAAGVQVREPRGIDAVPSRFLTWVSGEVPDERIDRDIPLTALGDLRWLT